MRRLPTPRHPTRERRLYGAAARGYAAAMRDLFLFPLEVRRDLRMTHLLDEDVISRIAVWPDIQGPLKSEHADGSAAADAAFIYWTMHERRPRALLRTAADAIRREFERRTDAARRAEAERYAHEAAHVYECRRKPRADLRHSVAALLDQAAWVYMEPVPACRMILRSLRRHGAEQTRRVLEKKPQTFGRLRFVRVWWFGFWPVDDTEVARRMELPVLVRMFGDAVKARQKAGKPGPALAARKRAQWLEEDVQRTKQPRPDGGWLKMAARLIAILMRRRDVDEKRDTSKPLPTIKHQLSAMLPAEAHALIDEALRLSETCSGEDPIWIRGHSMGVELGTGRAPSLALGLPSPELAAPGPELPAPAPELPDQPEPRAPERGRGRGLDI